MSDTDENMNNLNNENINNLNDNINLNNINLNNINPNDIKNLLNTFNLDKDNKIQSLLNDLSGGDIGSLLKSFSNIVPDNKNEETTENMDFDISQDNLDIEEENMDSMDDTFELNLEKYFLASNGQNICDILLDVKTELKNINEKLSK